MISSRGLHWLALATLLGTSCDKTLSFDPPLSGEGGEPGSGGVSGRAGNGTGGSAIGQAGSGEPWHTGGSSTNPPSTGGTGFTGIEECIAYCAILDQRCHELEGTCVECFKDQDCESSGRYCDRGLNRCVTCREEFGCPDAKRCENGMCREPCATEAHPDRDCHDSTQVCDDNRNVCISCGGDDDCAASDDGPFCLPGGARCAECVADGDCGGGTPRCDPVLFRCVACRDSRDCELPFVCHPVTHGCYDSGFGAPYPT